MLTNRDMAIMEFCNNYGGITIKQASKIFFDKAKYSYDRARKRLRILADNGILKYSNTWSCKERIYHTNKKGMSAHDLKLLDVYAELVSSGCTILEFKKELEFMEGTVRCDGFVHAKTRQGTEFIMAIEIDFTHLTEISKYELLYHSQVLQEEYGVFPRVLIITNSNKRYNSRDFIVQTIPHNLSNFNSIVQF